MLKVTETPPDWNDKNPLARAIAFRQAQGYDISFANEFAHLRLQYEVQAKHARMGIDGGMRGLLAVKYATQLKGMFEVGRNNGILRRSSTLQQLAEQEKVVQSLRDSMKRMFGRCPKCGYELQDESFKGEVATE